MISFESKDVLNTKIMDYIIPGEKVAHVQPGNNLEHALLVLTKSGYTAIPVLDEKFKLEGLISSPMITEAILGLERIEFEKLEDMRVEEVMSKDQPHLTVNDHFRKALGLLINHPFLCVTDEEGAFQGILTRRVILKHLNYHVDQLS
ncbi:putative transcriptional regulator [Bacillus ectoiniformans]|uniref:cyclic-di-AMP-binding protein CbpB n=1 Tax=Bacillus ectoiniformans TaxID=1494429 RepID=UPI00195BB529|nr:cyclic-di-AMP-binding protein CbpB [Bacillus ectoiniformans]MBM7647298.1 putative transcriptional regulator [Bacillus ectoiniformans]